MAVAPEAGIAFWLETINHSACEMAALIGYRMVVLDMEHGVFDPASADRLVAYCRTLGLSVAVRVATAERVAIQQALDAGADSVILPQITDLAHAREVCSLAKFPPLGTRGIGYSRTMDYGGASDRFPGEENSRRLCYAMIETPGALRDAARIAALDCVDGLFLGPGDLSLTRGRGVNRWRVADREDMAKVAKAARSAGKRWALPATSPEILRLALGMRPDYVVVADDLSALYSGLKASYEPLQRLGEAPRGGSRKRRARLPG